MSSPRGQQQKYLAGSLEPKCNIQSFLPLCTKRKQYILSHSTELGFFLPYLFSSQVVASCLPSGTESVHCLELMWDFTPCPHPYPVLLLLVVSHCSVLFYSLYSIFPQPSGPLVLLQTATSFAGNRHLTISQLPVGMFVYIL